MPGHVPPWSAPGSGSTMAPSRRARWRRFALWRRARRATGLDGAGRGVWVDWRASRPRDVSSWSAAGTGSTMAPQWRACTGRDRRNGRPARGRAVGEGFCGGMWRCAAEPPLHRWRLLGGVPPCLPYALAPRREPVPSALRRPRGSGALGPLETGRLGRSRRACSGLSPSNPLGSDSYCLLLSLWGPGTSTESVASFRS